jgi:dTDP-4-amino-4,6-dideoxygalactose transaminase
MENSRFIMGKEVVELEQELADYVGVRHCLTCSSGTDALLIPLMAYGIGKGDAVFVPTFTFYASAEVVALTGASPIFIDVKQDTFNIDVEKLEIAIKEVINEGKLKPKCIMPVDLFGLPADYDAIYKIAKKYNLIVLEDGAQGFGGEINNQKACSFGDVAATSFFPAKPLGCYGDGGAIFTNNNQIAEIMKSIRIHGHGADRYENIRIGLNGRLDTLQAAVLLEKLRIFNKEIENRNKIAMEYTHRLKDYLLTPFIGDGYLSSWAQYSILAKSNDERTHIMEHLKSKDIPTMIYYPIPLHSQKVFYDLNKTYCDLSVSEQLVDRIFSIPMHPYITDEEIKDITESIIECL